ASTGTPSPARSRPRRRASVSRAALSLTPSTSTTARASTTSPRPNARGRAPAEPDDHGNGGSALLTSNASARLGLAASPRSCRILTGFEPAPTETEERDARVGCDIFGGSRAMTEHAVVIAGAGPTGLMLAGELALAGVDVAVVERRASQDLIGSRAGGLHARTIEALDQRGIAERFLSQGQVAQVAGFAWIRLDISDFPTRHNYGLALWQNQIERILAG